MRQPILRRCPHCGVQVSWRAHTCFMCGVRLDGRSPAHLRSLGIDLLLMMGVLAAAWLLWRHVPRPQEDLFPTPIFATPVAIASPTPVSAVVVSPVATRRAASTFEAIGTPTPIVHVVQQGESLEYIAGFYGVRVSDIVTANALEDPDRLQVGQRLVIPVPTSPPPETMASPTAAAVTHYIVQEGDTLSAIAVRFRVSIAALQAANNLGKSELIRVGDTLIIPTPFPTVPASEPSAALTVTANPTSNSPYRWPAPPLLSPANGAVIASVGEPLLRWAAVGLLDQDEWYVVRLWPADPNLPSPPTYWTKGTSWRVGSEWRPSEVRYGRRYLWQVVVLRAHGEGASRRVIEATSPLSEIRSFTWGEPEEFNAASEP
ncbi:MAG: LysM peptidoglycan-binding domain-containing protein [Anaerolineae bacterium]|nr:LysM peptidoglycan-binding domain-containing protein [Anaerolineae bacterium]MDW8100429.1 LysM peptidoglycan-binding domain-containing protein [Anaerolineae bacterium]